MTEPRGTYEPQDKAEYRNNDDWANRTLVGVVEMRIGRALKRTGAKAKIEDMIKDLRQLDPSIFDATTKLFYVTVIKVLEDANNVLLDELRWVRDDLIKEIQERGIKD